MEDVNERIQNLLSSNFERCIIEKTRGLDFYHSNEAIKSSLIKILSLHYPLVQIHLFGSRVMGVGSKTSDLDIYVDINQSYYTVGYKKRVMQTVLDVEQIMLNYPNEWDNLYVKNAEIPLIKVFNKIYKIKCDISLSDGEGHRNTRLMQFLCDLQPDFRSMIIILGFWLEYAELSIHINNHTLRLLILNYLQIRNLLPSIQALQMGILDPLEIGPWNVDFDRTRLNVIKIADLDNLIKGFFKHYGSFGQFDGIVCTYLGKLVPKQFCTIDVAYEFSNLNVRGPFNLTQNPARKISNKILDKFIDLAQKSYRFLMDK